MCHIRACCIESARAMKSQTKNSFDSLLSFPSLFSSFYMRNFQTLSPARFSPNSPILVIAAAVWLSNFQQSPATAQEAPLHPSNSSTALLHLRTKAARSILPVIFSLAAATFSTLSRSRVVATAKFWIRCVRLGQVVRLSKCATSAQMKRNWQRRFWQQQLRRLSTK